MEIIFKGTFLEVDKNKVYEFVSKGKLDEDNIKMFCRNRSFQIFIENNKIIVRGVK